MVKLDARPWPTAFLAEGLDSDRAQDLEPYKQQADALFKKLSRGPPPPPLDCEAGRTSCTTYRGRVCYLTLSDRGYPSWRISTSRICSARFRHRTAPDRDGARQRVHQFDTFIETKVVPDTRRAHPTTQRGSARHPERDDAQHSGHLGTGERLDHVSSMSDGETSRCSDRRRISADRRSSKCLPYAVVFGFVFLLLFFRYVVFASRR